MIAAVLAPSAPAAVERHARAFGGCAEDMGEPASLLEPSSGLFSFRGSPPGRLDPTTSTAWIGSLRSFSPEAPLRSRGDFAFITASRACGGELSLGRGWFGGRSLFYTVDVASKSLLACSRMRPLVAATGDRNLCIDALGAYLLGV